MTLYQEIRIRQQKEFDAFPIKAAFSNAQFEKAMRDWGFSPSDTDKIVSIGAGCFIRKSDKDSFLSMCKRHDEEMEKAKQDGGATFYYDMFYHELKNHEYGYTGDSEETLNSLGYTLEEVKENPVAWEALHKAEKQIMKEAANW